MLCKENTNTGGSPSSLSTLSLLCEVHLFLIIPFSSETETELVVDQSGDINSTYQSFLDSLPQQDIRWALMDFQFRTARGPSSKV